MTKLDKLLNLCNISGINVDKTKLPSHVKAVYYSDINTEPTIAISNEISTYTEESCVLAEELGHHYTSSGDLLTDKQLNKAIIRKQERYARAWAYSMLVPLTAIVEAYEAGISNRYDLAEFLGVTEQFLIEAITYYNEKYGLYAEIDNYVIYFEPLGVLKMLI